MRKYEKLLIAEIEKRDRSCECCGAFGYQPNCSGCCCSTTDLLNELAKLRGFDNIHEMGDFEMYLGYKLGELPFNQSFHSDEWEKLLAK